MMNPTQWRGRVWPNMTMTMRVMQHGDDSDWQAGDAGVIWAGERQVRWRYGPMTTLKAEQLCIRPNDYMYGPMTKHIAQRGSIGWRNERGNNRAEPCMALLWVFLLFLCTFTPEWRQGRPSALSWDFLIYISDFLMFLSEKMRFFPKRKAE